MPKVLKEKVYAGIIMKKGITAAVVSVKSLKKGINRKTVIVLRLKIFLRIETV